MSGGGAVWLVPMWALVLGLEGPWVVGPYLGGGGPGGPQMNKFEYVLEVSGDLMWHVTTFPVL